MAAEKGLTTMGFKTVHDYGIQGKKEGRPLWSPFFVVFSAENRSQWENMGKTAVFEVRNTSQGETFSQIAKNSAF